MELVDAKGDPAAPRRTVQRSQLPWLEALRAKCAAPTEPLFATELGLTKARRPPPSDRELLENGALLLTKVRDAVASSNLGRLRKLCAWFPFPTLYLREVHDLLDGLGRDRAQQIAGRPLGDGRPAEPVEQIALIVTMECLMAEKRMSAARAAREIKRKAPPIGIATVHGLENLRGQLGKLARCLRGYRIPPEEVLRTRWGEKAADQFAVHFVEGSGSGNPSQQTE
jgi:hypothetical protein